MMWQTRLLTGAFLVIIAAPAPAQEAADLYGLQVQAIKAAAKSVAPSVVQIETSGGTDVVGSGPRGQQVLKGIGPTTGLIVGADGYIVSSAYNFSNNPSAIFVAVPGHEQRYVAKVVANDETRMLTLLKIEATGLPVPKAAPRADLKVGQMSIALGRALDPDANHPPSISKGILSALDRIWGKAVQTDAKISPVNYGGPLIDVQGRVIGVLIPASPRGEDETAGIEWYDSGIGFAIPLEDINKVLPRLKEGKPLKRGLLGVSMQNQDIYGAKPVISTVAPDSAAEKAGIKPGDEIVEIDGEKVVRQAQILHLLGPRYEGDEIALKVKRDKDEIEFPKVKLLGKVEAHVDPFLGIVPVRDDPEPGVEVRYVYPKSPADTAGLKAGDRILKVGGARTPVRAFSGRDQLMSLLATAPVGTEVKLEVKRKDGKTETLTAKLATLPDTVPDSLPAPASAKKALEPRKAPGGGNAEPAPPKQEEKKPETGLLKRTDAAGDRTYWVYVPENYDPNIAHAVVIWLHPTRRGGQDAEDLVAAWKKHCEDRHIILIGPRAENETGWVASEVDFVVQTARDVIGQYTVDPQRVVAHGMGVGGQMAYYLAFNARDLIRGVATTGAVLTSTVKDNTANQRLSFYLVAGGKDPLAKDIAESKNKLTERKFPVILRQIPEMGQEYLTTRTLDELLRWIDSLDRI